MEANIYEAVIGLLVALVVIFGGIFTIGRWYLARIDNTKRCLTAEVKALDEKTRKNIAEIHRRIDTIEKDGVSREELMSHMTTMENTVNQGLQNVRERIDDIYKLLFEAAKKGSSD